MKTNKFLIFASLFGSFALQAASPNKPVGYYYKKDSSGNWKSIGNWKDSTYEFFDLGNSCVWDPGNDVKIDGMNCSTYCNGSMSALLSRLQPVTVIAMCKKE